MKPAIHFKYEKLTDHLMSMDRYNVNLKFVVDLGGKDKNGEKKEFASQYKYPSNKYNDTDHLLTMKRNFKSYLSLEYPSKDPTRFGTGSIMIGPSSIRGFRKRIEKFQDILSHSFKKYDGKIELKTNTSIISQPDPYHTIEFSPDIYYKDETDEGGEYGIRMIINDGEYDFVIPYNTSWQEFLYYIYEVDFYGWASIMVNNLTTNMIGKLIDDVGDYSYKSNYTQETPDKVSDKKNANITRSKPLSNNDKKKSFFD